MNCSQLKILDTYPVTYKLKDYNGEVLQGSFYEQEMLRTETADYYEINEILKTRMVGKKKEYLVSFLGWPSPKFDLWVTEADIYDIPKN